MDGLDFICYNFPEVYMDETQPAPGSPIYQETKQGGSAKWLWLLITLIIIGAVVFAVVRGIGPFANLGISLNDDEAASPVPSSSVVSSPTAEATSAANLDKSEPEIRVLNGSGTAGAASAMKDTLEGKGYKVISLGNADSYDFSQTVVRLKEAFEAFGDLLLSDLSDDYSVRVDSEFLEATDSADIEVIVGTK